MGHLGKYVNYGHCSQSISKVSFKLDDLKEISGNRFISINNHGFKVYSLNEKNEYSIVSISDYLNGIKYIHEISENKFIICISKNYRNRNYFYFFDHYGTNEIFIQMMEMKGITKEEKNKKLDDLNQDGYHINRRYFSIFFVVPEKDEKFKDDELKKLIESLKLTCSFKGIMSFREEEMNHLCNYVLIKNYFIIMINNSIFVIDSTNGKILKRYLLSIDGLKKKKIRYLFDDNNHIQKWNSPGDNQFILFLYGNVILFEFNEDGKENVDLKILNYSYFPEIRIINDIKKLNEGNNKFCLINKDSISIY